MKSVYLDNAATTFMLNEVCNEISNCDKFFNGNPSSIHQLGVGAMKLVEESRCNIANSINCEPEELYFTSGGTESNNWVIKSLATSKDTRKTIITSSIEHPSVLEPIKWLEKNFNFKVKVIDVDRDGVINLKKLEEAVNEDVALCSIMHVNNEIGSIQPIELISKICGKYEALFHTDACQSFLKVPLDVKKSGVNFLSINAHKVNGPKGVGALYISKESKLEPLLHGGGQEFGQRSTTLNTSGIVGFGKAVNLQSDLRHMEHIAILSKWFKERLVEEFSFCVINNNEKYTIPNIINLRFNNILGKTLMWNLNKVGIYVSTASACSSNKNTPSRVLENIGLSEKENLESLRISLGVLTTKAELEYVLEMLKKIFRN